MIIEIIILFIHVKIKLRNFIYQLVERKLNGKTVNYSNEDKLHVFFKNVLQNYTLFILFIRNK